MVDETEELQLVHYRDILNIRNPRYRCTADLKIRTRAEAVKFINSVGIALLFPGDNMALPDLWSAINGYQRAIPKHHHDSALSKTWNWKDEIPTRKEAWYGKLI
jgi:hypothetical protein